MTDRTIFFVTFAWLAVACALASPKERSMPSVEGEELERRMMDKRAGARAFGPRMVDLDPYLYQTSKRFGGLSPYYFYQQPKRGGGRSFSNYWSPPVATSRFYEDSPFFKKRSAYSTDDYLF